MPNNYRFSDPCVISLEQHNMKQFLIIYKASPVSHPMLPSAAVTALVWRWDNVITATETRGNTSFHKGSIKWWTASRVKSATFISARQRTTSPRSNTEPGVCEGLLVPDYCPYLWTGV